MATLCRIALQSTLLISRVFVSWAPTLCLCTRALSFLLVVEDDFLPSCGLSDFFPARPSWQSFSCVCHFFHQHFFYRHIHITVAIACVRSRRQQEFSERVFPLARYRWRGNRVSAVPCISTSERFFSSRYRDFVMDELVNWFLSCAAFPSGSFVSKLILHNISWFHHFWVQLGGQTDYVEVDDQERWDTTRATISCSLRYIWLTLRLCIIHLLFFFLLGLLRLVMLYLCCSR